MKTTPSALFSHTALLAAFALTLSFGGCKSAAPPDDNALNSALQSKLTSDVAIGSEPIQTFVQGGVATLQGSVSSEAAKALAASDASQVAGIRSVVNQLTVQTAQALPQPIPAEPVPVPQPLPARPSAPIPAPSRRSTPRNTPPPIQQSAPIERRPLPPPEQEQAAEPAPPPRRVPPAPAFRNVTLPSGTTLPVRITQTLDSATTQPGETFSGTITNDVIADGLVAIPAGTAVSGRVDEVHEAARFKGSSLLTISLVSVNRRGEHLTVATDPYSQQGKGRGKNTAEKVGGGAAVGAILGGIFGGGTGAAIGGLAGGGVGAGAQAVTRGQQVQIPSETLIRFRLSSPVDVRASTTAGSDTDPSLQHHSDN